jgi:hypothetical protein
MDGSEALRRLLVRNFIYHPSCVFRRSVFEELGGLDTSPEFQGIDDFDFWLRVAEGGGSFGYIPSPLLLYRVWPGNMSRDVVRDSEATLRILAKAQKRSPGLYDKFRPLLRRRIADLHRRLGVGRLAQGNSSGWKDVWQALRLGSSPVTCLFWLATSVVGLGPWVARRRSSS